MAQATQRPFVVGLCGAQGSGKSTLSNGLAARFADDGIGTAILSLDDLYHTRERRAALAAQVHPLLRTRGVPGTHEVSLGLAVFEDLDRRRDAALPRFDKGQDDRCPVDLRDVAPAYTQLLIFEGWCVGSRPQSPRDLVDPVNDLEREEDPEGVWRAFVNQALANDYQRLFARIDFLILLSAPGFEVVAGWRAEQERDLRQRAGADAPGVMSDAEVRRFVQFYERLSRHILREMPHRADVHVELAPDRTPRAIHVR